MWVGGERRGSENMDSKLFVDFQQQNNVCMSLVFSCIISPHDTGDSRKVVASPRLPSAQIERLRTGETGFCPHASPTICLSVCPQCIRIRAFRVLRSHMTKRNIFREPQIPRRERSWYPLVPRDLLCCQKRYISPNGNPAHWCGWRLVWVICQKIKNSSELV